MSLADNLRDHVVIVVSIVAITAFGVGWKAYDAIVKAQGQELVLTTRLTDLERKAELFEKNNSGRVGRSSCAQNACLKPDGSCGTVELWAGTTLDKRSHGNDLSVHEPLPKQKYPSNEPAKLQGGEYLAVEWQCL